MLPLGQEFPHPQVLQRWFWVHDTRRQDISAGLCRHTSSRVALNYLPSSSTCRNENIETIYCNERDLLCTRNASRTSSSKECFRSGDVSGEPMWQRCQVWFLLLPVLHRGSGWGRDCTLEYSLRTVSLIHPARLTSLHETSFSQGRLLGTVDNSASCPSLNSLCDSRCGGLGSGKNIGYLDKACLCSYRFPAG